jgi:hypothetical protein
MAIGDVYQLVRKINLNGNLHLNVLNFLQTDEVAGGAEDALNEAFQVAATSNDPVNSRLTLLQRGFGTLERLSIDIKRISVTEGEVFQYSHEPPGPQVPVAGLPNYASVKILINSSLNTRSGKGGFFLGGIAESDTTQNVLTSSAMTSYFDPLLTAIEDAFHPNGTDYSGFHIGVWSRVLQQFNVAVSLGYSTQLGTTNSRKLGRGV